MEFEENLETQFANLSGHPEMKGGDAEKCPHLQFLKKNPGSTHNPAATEKKSEKKNAEQDQEKDEESDVSSDEE